MTFDLESLNNHFSRHFLMLENTFETIVDVKHRDKVFNDSVFEWARCKQNMDYASAQTLVG